ncbi:unnamed protein product [Pleuronectes platessa]|uniref:Family with sequence similarity 98 member A n=1 Tax=Pleuronectes platessa TaxID=8262 RepID=A0A9N7V4R4_PLEPL|nr:unnamed protein product [Pleuronectes platessa]
MDPCFKIHASPSPSRPSRGSTGLQDTGMENDTIVSLEDLGYQGPLLEEGALETAVSGGAASPEFTKLCAWIVSELRLYCKLEENVHATNCPSEAEGFQLEMSGLLSELACPYAVLISGNVNQRLLNRTDCLLLLTFLVSELEASRMILVNSPQKKGQDPGSPVFQELKGICMSLGMSKPPANITMFQFFSGIEKKLKEALCRVPPNHVGDPLMKKALGPMHLEKIEPINQALVNEYEVRRKMLLKRLDVTVQSFGWSERAKTHAEKLAKVYPPLRSALCTASKISVAHLFAARQDFSKILRTSSGMTREKTACAINKVRMGRVPDRGGRPCEIEVTMVGAGTEAAGGAMITSPKVAVEAMREDMETGEVEGAAEEGRYREAGERVVVEEAVEAVTTKVTFRMQQAIMGVEGEGVMEQVGTTKEVSRTLGIMGEEEAEAVTMTVTTKTEAGIRREAGAEEDVGAGEGESEEDKYKGEAGEGEGARILTMEDSLNSSSNKAGSTTTKLALLKADTSQVEKTVSRVHPQDLSLHPVESHERLY